MTNEISAVEQVAPAEQILSALYGDAASKLQRVSGENYLVALHEAGPRKAPRQQGIFVVPGTLNRATFRAVMEEAQRNGVASAEDVHIYTHRCIYSGPKFHIGLIGDVLGYAGGAA